MSENSPPTETAPQEQARRILLALDCVQDRIAQEAAALLALALRARLEGLFVEDPDLVRLTALPFIREVALYSAAVRPLAAGDLERQLRGQVGEVRRWFGARTGGRRIDWTLSVVRGRLLEQTLQAAGGSALLILGRPAARLLAQPPHGRREVLSVYDGSPAAERALEAAMTISTGGLGPLRLLVPLTLRPEPWQRLRKRLETEKRPIIAHVMPVGELGLKTLTEAARRYRAQLIVLGEMPGLTEAANLQTLQRQTDCPLVVVR